MVSGSRSYRYPVIRDHVDMQKVFLALQDPLATPLFNSVGIICDTDMFSYGTQFVNVLHSVPIVGSTVNDPQYFSSLLPATPPYVAGVLPVYEFPVPSAIRRSLNCPEIIVNLYAPVLTLYG